MRGLALVLVVLFHLGRVFWAGSGNWPFRGGFVGVDLWLALSGFLVTTLLLDEHQRRGGIDLPRFIGRRLLRLSPALAVLLTIVMAASLANLIPHPARFVFESSLWTFVFAPSWPSTGHLIAPDLGHTWALAVGVQFILASSVIVALASAIRRHKPQQILGGAAIAAAVAIAVHRAAQLRGGHLPTDLFVNSPYRLDEPLVGALGGIAYVSGWFDRLPPRWVASLVASGLATIGVVAVVARPFDEWLYQGGLTGIAVVATIVVVGMATLHTGMLADALRWPPLVWLGETSYSIFLWHLPVFVVVQREATGLPVGLRAGAALSVAIALGLLSYRWVEEPARRLRKDPR